ncbi:MAG TPA: hypothetical protein VF896_13290, partial [Anaerolineales bacterium]
VQMELTEEGILIRPPENHSHDQVSSSGEQESADAEREPMEVSSSLLKVWQSLKSRFMRSPKNPNGDEK